MQRPLRSSRHPLRHSLYATLLAVLLVPAAFVYDVWSALPTVDGLESFTAAQSVVITDRDGTELYRLFGDEDRVNIPLTDLPPYVPQAFIAIEDERFGERPCVDMRAISRAVLANVSDYKSQGASTITQQLARAAFLTHEKTIRRKLSELFLACRLEQTLTQEQILELYLNWIPFGSNVYGIEQASQLYFNAPASTLSVAQAAVLASLPQRPSYFSPHGPNRHTTVDPLTLGEIQAGTLVLGDIPQESLHIGLLPGRIETPSGAVLLGGRSSQVLSSMEVQGRLSAEAKERADQELRTMQFAEPIHRITAPHFVFWVREQLLALADERTLRDEGIRVETTLDPTLQQYAEELLSAALPSLQTEFGARHAALVAVDRRSREILAYVGNADFFSDDAGQVDMARSPRQPGSSFKPIVYAAAFENGASPETVVYDVPVTIGDYTPRNYEGGYFGRMTMRQALGSSRNIPALKAFYWAGGEEAVLRFASRLGVSYPSLQKERLNRDTPDRFRYGWPLALGSAEAPLLEMTQAYTTLANNGVFAPLRSIRTIRTAQNDLIQAPFYSPEETRVLSESSAQAVTSILSDPNARPDGYWRDQLTLEDEDAAVKTGTSSKCTNWKNGECLQLAPDNVWTIGYSPELVVGVWVGNADGSPLSTTTNGLVAASPLWRDFLLRAQSTRAVSSSRFFGSVEP